MAPIQEEIQKLTDKLKLVNLVEETVFTQAESKVALLESGNFSTEVVNDYIGAIVAAARAKNDMITLINSAFRQYIENLDSLKGKVDALESHRLVADEAKEHVGRQRVKFAGDKDEEIERDVEAKENKSVIAKPFARPMEPLRMPESPELHSSCLNSTILNSTRKREMPKSPQSVRKPDYTVKPRALNFDDTIM